jgi:hypothetical protein
VTGGDNSKREGEHGHLSATANSCWSMLHKTMGPTLQQLQSSKRREKPEENLDSQVFLTTDEKESF